MTLEPLERAPALTSPETMNTGPTADVVYILTSLSQSGESKVSVLKYPAVIITTDRFTDPSFEARVEPHLGSAMSIEESQVIFLPTGEDGRDEPRVVP